MSDKIFIGLILLAMIAIASWGFSGLFGRNLEKKKNPKEENTDE